jgi:hypothetical protein
LIGFESLAELAEKNIVIASRKNDLVDPVDLVYSFFVLTGFSGFIGFFLIQPFRMKA